MDIIATDKAPRAIGPYSQAVLVGNVIYTAGQIALDPSTMQIVGQDVAEQTDRVLKNLAAVLEQAGSSLQHVVKTTVFLADMADFPAMNDVYARHFGDHRPARSTVAVRTLPKDARVEIDAVALRRR
ncbi:MAG: RidA family protein [Gemmatimonadetes bacterium]|nr:RidA family protein [Gemmatimonadota bacterium]MBI2536280.1 RidA family protein [Gemmatimonadota bacterium]MBI2616452.1 RidA family protein [Gemmatimonadota bacterium]